MLSVVSGSDRITEIRNGRRKNNWELNVLFIFDVNLYSKVLQLDETDKVINQESLQVFEIKFRQLIFITNIMYLYVMIKKLSCLFMVSLVLRSENHW